MALSLTNLNSSFAQNSLSKTTSSMSSTFAKLSSGFRINKASDDAAGLAISEQLNAELRSLAAAQRSTATGISITSVADSALSTQGDMLARMRELAVSASDGALSTTDRDALNTEYQSLYDEVSRISATTSFNGNQLLSGAASDIDIQTGADAGNQISITTGGLDAATLGGAGFSAVTLAGDGSQASSAIDQIDDALGAVNARRAELGATENRLSSASEHLQTQRTNKSAALSRIRDTDYAQESSTLAALSVMKQQSAALLAQANIGGIQALRLIQR